MVENIIAAKTEGNTISIKLNGGDIGSITISGVEFVGTSFISPSTEGLQKNFNRLLEKMWEYPEEGKNTAEKMGLGSRENIVGALRGEYREEGKFAKEKEVWLLLFKNNEGKIMIGLVESSGKNYLATEIEAASKESPNPTATDIANNKGFPNATYRAPPYLSADLKKEKGINIDTKNLELPRIPS